MKKTRIFDGHNDTLTKLNSLDLAKGQTFFMNNADGQLDLPKARKGGMIGGLFGIFVPPPKTAEHKKENPYSGVQMSKAGSDDRPKNALDHTYASTYTNAVIDFAYKLENQSNGEVQIVQSYQELEDAIESGALAMVLHFEGAAAISEDLSDLQGYYDKGLRSLGLVWSRSNAFCHGVPFMYPHSPDTGPGLTDAGKKLVAACNNLGIVLDLAHLNEKGFFDVAKLSNHPLVVSHIGAHALCPSTRNLTDEQIDAVGASGGTIGVVFAPFIVDYKVSEDGTPDNNMPISWIVRHIDYIAGRIGVDHVSLGSDFDGARMPTELPDASHLPKLIDALKSGGFSEDSIEKIASKNWLRVIRQTWTGHV
ncbi:MAG: membrane dipeptidase [Chloroflexi bacterium]|jgi:membrane dipeptidase|nr:membrane dipeptidase [Chloroflexota bacterium]MBT7080912.1 membrane dipeptidase [Chloroflexota bacterium]